MNTRKLRGLAASVGIALAITSFFGCASPPPQIIYVTMPMPADVADLGKDLKSVSQDLAKAPVNNAALGKDLTQLGKDLPQAAQNLKILGTYPNATPLEQNLGALGTDLAALTHAAALSTLGQALSASPVNNATVTAAQNALGTDLAGLAPHLAQLGATLATPNAAGGVSNDISPFSSTAELLSQHIKALAATLAAAPPGQPGALLAGTGNNMNDISGDFSAPILKTNRPVVLSRMNIMGGIITLAPYTIGGDGTTGTNRYHIVDNNTQVYGTVNVNYHDRWAWDGPSKNNLWGTSTFGNLLNRLDFQMRAGYVFSQTKTNASTILGSGNFSGEFALGFRAFQARDDSAQLAQSLNFPEINVSLVTDRGFSETHPTTTLGPSYVAAFPSGNTNGPARLLFRPGISFSGLPDFTDGAYINSNGHGAPKYVSSAGWAVETEFDYPIASGSSLQAGARIYGGHYPSDWVVWIGATYSFDKIVKLVQTGNPFGSP